MDIGDWLRGLGLAQYEERFREHAIEADVLSQITADDLKEIGVAAVGHRRRLLEAIAELGRFARADVAPTGVKAALEDAERRPLTLMFCDLAGSTGLAVQLDAEDWRNLLGAYHEAAAAAIEAHDGYVLKKLGDGLIASFGYPQARENDAERAVRAALSVQRALAELNARNTGSKAPKLAARIGLDSGSVVVDATGDVFGEAPNIAARVQNVAGPGEVYVTRAVHEQIAGLFIAEDKGEQALRGVPFKVQLYRIVRSSGSGRHDRARALTTLLGRDKEIAQLQRRWERAKAGEGQLALIVGEAGIGKSRMMNEFRTCLGATPHTWVGWSSSQLLQNTPLHPAAQWAQSRFGSDPTPPDERYGEIENALRLVGLDPAKYAPLLSPLAGVSPPTTATLRMAPEDYRRAQLAAIVDWLFTGARAQPLLLTIEDLHWADPTTLELLQILGDRGGQFAIFVVATARPEFRPPWNRRAHHDLISLAPLDRADVARMVLEITAQRALPQRLVEGVAERTGGVPLFVEEITRLLLERGESAGVQAIPLTLQQSLAARLDRLGGAREIAQIGSVLGREFALPLLRAVAGQDDATLRASLDRLVEADMLYVEGEAEGARYRFKHALVQDAAYDSLLRSRRQTLHRRAAEALADPPSAEPELVAHHFTQAGLSERAIEWWSKAGEQALRRSAFPEAAAHLAKAIELFDLLDEAHPDPAAPAEGSAEAKAAAQKGRLRLRLHASYAQALTITKGFAAEETKLVYERAGALAARAPGEPQFWTISHLRIFRFVARAEHPSAREESEAFVRNAESAKLAGHAAFGRHWRGFVRFFMGDFVGARDDEQAALQLHDETRDARLRFVFGADFQSNTLAVEALANWSLGEAEAARIGLERADIRARQVGHLHSLALGGFIEAQIAVLGGRVDFAREKAENLIKLAEETSMRDYARLGAIIALWARGRRQKSPGAALEFRAAMADYEATGARVYLPQFHGMLADLEASVGALDEALATLDQGLAIAEATSERCVDAFLRRIGGAILVNRNARAAEEAFARAIETARAQQARAFTLAAALPLARLYKEERRYGEARDTLTLALKGLAPSAFLPEVDDGRALLAALSN